jgi:DNA-binding CsgD family transcriptional regulator
MAQYLPTVPRFGPVFTKRGTEGDRGARTIPSHLRLIAFVVGPVIEVPQGTKKFKPTALPKQSWASRQKAIVKKAAGFPKLVQNDKKRPANRETNLFVFCDKATGVSQFRAESDVNLESTVERIAGLLAMQCLVRGQEPRDFEVMVPAQGILVEQLVSRAQTLLEEGRAVACPGSLSPRQKEILHSVLRNKANKEIATVLNITVRTVKFHISALLSKFGVENRGELARRAAGFLRPEAGEPAGAEPAAPPADRRGMGPFAVNSGSGLRVTSRSRTDRFSAGRVLTA